MKPRLFKLLCFDTLMIISVNRRTFIVSTIMAFMSCATMGTAVLTIIQKGFLDRLYSSFNCSYRLSFVANEFFHEVSVMLNAFKSRFDTSRKRRFWCPVGSRNIV